MTNIRYVFITFLFYLFCFETEVEGQIIIPNSSFTYNQDFNSLAVSGTSSTLPLGWAFFETGTNADATYSAGTGSSTTGDTYSFGVVNGIERCFGGLQSGPLIPTIGVCFKNNTGSVITGFKISYTGETWRVGGASRPDSLKFQYRQNTSSINSAGTWISIPALDYGNPGQVTGNGSMQHSNTISVIISGLNISADSTFCFRWVSYDASGSDDGMGIDDFIMEEIKISPGISIAESNSSTNVSEGGEKDTFTLVLNTQPLADVTINIMPGMQTTTSPTSLVFTTVNWNVPQNVIVAAVDDLLFEGNHTSLISFTTTSADINYSGIIINGKTANITDNESCIPFSGPLIDNVNVCEGGSTLIRGPTIGGPNPMIFTAKWDFEGEVTVGSIPMNVTAKLAVPNTTAGSGLSALSFPAGNNPSPVDSYSAANWTIANAPDANDYFEFCINALSGNRMDVSSISFDAMRSSTGPQMVQLTVSVNGGSFVNIGSVLNIPTGYNANPMFLQNLSLNDVQNVCIRLYGYGSTGSSGTLRVDNVSLGGSVFLAGNYRFFALNPTVNPLITPVYMGYDYDPGTNTSTSPDTIWVTTVDAVNGCESIPDSVLISVRQKPNLNIIQPSAVCSPAIVDITSVILGQNPTGGNISYHQNESDANNGINPVIIGLSNFSVTGNVFVRYELPNSCFITGEIKAIINEKPQSPDIPSVIIKCDLNSFSIPIGFDTVNSSFTWDFENGISSSGRASNNSISSDGLPLDAGIGLSGVGPQGAGFGCSSAVTSSGYDSNNLTLADAISDGEYFEFCSGTPLPEYLYIGVTNVRWNHRRTDSGPMQWALVAANNPAIILLSGSVNISCMSVGDNILLNPSQCYRIYYWGATSSAGTLRIDNFELDANYVRNLTYHWYDANPALNPGIVSVYSGVNFQPILNTAVNPNEFFVTASSLQGCLSDAKAVSIYLGTTAGSISCGDYHFSTGEKCSTEEIKEYLQSKLYNPGFSIQIKSKEGLPIPDGSLKNYLSKTLVYEVKNVCTNNFCWGNIKVEDKSHPVMATLKSFYVECADKEQHLVSDIHSTTLIGRPFIRDNCGFKDSSLTVHDFSGSCRGMIIRKWTYTDCGDNVISASDTVNISDISNNRWMCPDSVVYISCYVGTTPQEIYKYFLNSTGIDSLASKAAWPWIKAGEGTFNPFKFKTSINGICGLLTTYSDKEIVLSNLCQGNKKVIRQWTIFDWCKGSIASCIQIIITQDVIAPTFSIRDTVVSARPWDCSADLWLPDVLDLYDNCDINPSYFVKTSTENVSLAWNSEFKKWRATGISILGAKFDYLASDCSGNVQVKSINVLVSDKVSPLSIAKKDIVITLSPGNYNTDNSEAYGKLFVTSIDNGSYDNCSNVRLELLRVSSPSNCGNVGRNGTFNNNRTFSNKFPASFPQTGAGQYSAQDDDDGEYVLFCCTDLDALVVDVNGDGKRDEGYSEVILRVWDDANKDGCIGCFIDDDFALQDNYNDTWAFVKVENKVPPVLSCPPNVTVSCEAPITTSTAAWASATPAVLSFTGVPTAWSACGTPAVEYRDVTDFSQCKTRNITRTFRIVGTTVTCTQNIIVSSTFNATTLWTFTGHNRDAPTATFNGAYDSGSSSPYHWPAVGGTVTYAAGVTPNNSPSLTMPTCGAFNENTVVSPFDIVYYSRRILETANCDGPSDKEIADKAPYYIQGPCDVIGLNVTKDQFNFEEGVCRKWVITYTYMNWCDNKCISFQRDWVYKDVVAPVIECTQRAPIPVGTDCKTNVSLSKSATDNGGCTVATTAGTAWLKWEVFVDQDANGTWDFAYSSFRTAQIINDDPWNLISYGEFLGATPTGVTNGTIPTKYLAPADPGTSVTIEFKNPIMGKSTFHKILWRVYDGCHNSTQCLEDIEVRDMKPPTPYCIHLSTALMAVPAGAPAGTTPMVEIWAKDFDRGATDFCTEQKDLKFTFNNWLPNADRINSQHYFDATGAGLDINAANTVRYNNGELQRWLPLSKSSAMIFTKANMPSVTLKVSVIDWNNNVDFCSVDLRLVCNDPVNCPPGAVSRIAGNVHTELGQGVMNVAVIANAALPEYPKQEMTDARGDYGMDIYSDTDTELKASKDGDDANGVSTLDLVIIQRHILGIQLMTSPYQLIAADANNDGSVTAMDLAEIRKVIMGMSDGYADNTSWRFPIENQVMSINQPFPYLESMMARPENTNGNYNFIAVKIGDVSGNASVNVSNPVAETRSSNQLVLTVEEQTLAAGEVKEIPVMSSNYKDITGFQYTMNLKGASFVGIQVGALDITDVKTGKLSADKVTMSYAGKEGETLAEGTVLFTIVVKADRAVKASEMISIGSAVSPAESYSSDFAVGRLSLEVRTAPVTAIQLNQNEPNPFKGQTSVSFVMPQAAAATISVYDVTGKVVSVRNINANKGLNSEIFTREQLGASGVMYYTLKSGEFSATKKMIIIE